MSNGGWYNIEYPDDFVEKCKEVYKNNQHAMKILSEEDNGFENYEAKEIIGVIEGDIRDYNLHDSCVAIPVKDILAVDSFEELKLRVKELQEKWELREWWYRLDYEDRNYFGGRYD